MKYDRSAASSAPSRPPAEVIIPFRPASGTEARSARRERPILGRKKLDITNPGNSGSLSLYDPAVALDFFQSAGKPQTIAKGTTIFSENEKDMPLPRTPRQIYLLLQGEVSVVANDEAIATIRSGEVFGEMASMGRMPRSASAVAKRECRVIALDDGQFQAALGRKPGFALMLMSVMASRLRETIAGLGDAASPADAGWREAAVLDKELLADLEQVLGPAARFRYEAGRIIMREGHYGVALFAVLEGRVTIGIGDGVVEKVGAGGVFGEMSLVDRAPRLATAVAETDCTLLAMSRHMFLHLVKRSPKFGAALLKAVGERAAFMALRRAERSAPSDARPALGAQVHQLPRRAGALSR
jgi:CRP/FNR family transcriptional regulator, cyclic AMP receptor protein